MAKAAVETVLHVDAMRTQDECSAPCDEISKEGYNRGFMRDHLPSLLLKGESCPGSLWNFLVTTS